MQRVLAILFFAAIIGVGGTFSVADDVVASKAVEKNDRVATLIGQLNSSSYAERQLATEELLELGAPAIAPLADAARNGGLEVAVRAIELLEKFYLSAEDIEYVAAEDALDRLIRAERVPSIASRAASILSSHYDIREKRAIRKIESHGGLVKMRTQNVPLNGVVAQVQQIEYVLLGTNWQGDEGLKYVKRLSKLTTLYIIDGVKMSQEARDDLEETLPDLNIQRRGRAYLGVAGFPLAGNTGGCQVTMVKDETAAAKAGIQPGDIIVGFDEQDVADFDALIKFIGEKNPGDKIQVRLLRLGQPKTVTVELDEWK